MSLLGSILIGVTYGLTIRYDMTEYQWWLGLIVIGIGVQFIVEG